MLKYCWDTSYYIFKNILHITVFINEMNVMKFYFLINTLLILITKFLIVDLCGLFFTNINLNFKLKNFSELLFNVKMDSLL